MPSSGLGLRERRSSAVGTKAPVMKNEEARQQDTLPSTAIPFHVEGYTLTPLQQRSWYMRRDVLPFGILYSVVIWLEQQSESESSLWMQHVLLPLGLLSQLSLVIVQQWRVSVKARVGYTVEPSPKKWTHVLVQASSGASDGNAGLAPIERPSLDVVTATFQNVVFRYEENAADTTEALWKTGTTTSSPPTRIFHRLHYPVDFCINFYTSTWHGHVSLESIQVCEAIYGTNTTHLQLPSFVSLLKQQLLAPFFLFQLFCVVLWSLDEYWYYALFTLGALLMFESTVAYNRRASVERLRNSMRHAQHVYVYRLKKWMVVNSMEVVPGDILSLSSRNHVHVPADVVLLQGTAVVDEALLTGESVPQIKSTIQEMASPTEHLSVKEHKQSILFGGTVLVSHTTVGGNGDTNNTTTDNTIPSPPPDGGVVGFALRTGFETAQGSLLRTMAHSSQKSADGIHTRDTFVFVGILLLCAVVSAFYVLLDGWYDETRNKFRLVLHVVIIITSVVPPELPMELSLAVTNSVADLMKRCRVYCTEPFRIPWAGQVDTCCFDKSAYIQYILLLIE